MGNKCEEPEGVRKSCGQRGRVRARLFSAWGAMPPDKVGKSWKIWGQFQGCCLVGFFI